MTATDIGRLRQIMYQPSACWLSTEYSGDRWLTDKYVLLNVTGDPGIQIPDVGPDGEAILRDPEDGPYKLTASLGLQPRDAIPQPDIEAYFGVIADYTWFPAEPTEWSVAEHPGKAQLWVSARRPVLLGEPTWTQIKRHYPDVEVDYSGTGNMFRFSRDKGVVGGFPFCYAAGIRIPDGQEPMAKALAQCWDTERWHSSRLTQLAITP